MRLRNHSTMPGDARCHTAFQPNDKCGECDTQHVVGQSRRTGLSKQAPMSRKGNAPKGCKRMSSSQGVTRKAPARPEPWGCCHHISCPIARSCPQRHVDSLPQGGRKQNPRPLASCKSVSGLKIFTEPGISFCFSQWLSIKKPSVS